ncbi:MAG: hypothetical protein KAU38_15100 [Desulfobacterales bacterium]|nr:hypothetical protein [Desulfobacterales bacterium]
MSKKVVRKRTEADGEISWKEIEFPKGGGFRSKYKTPSLKVGKYGLGLYCCDGLEGDMKVKIFSNGSKIAIVPDSEGSKKLKSDKKGKRISLPGKKVASQLNLEIGKVLSGSKGEIAGQEGWIFE